MAKKISKRKQPPLKSLMSEIANAQRRYLRKQDVESHERFLDALERLKTGVEIIRLTRKMTRKSARKAPPAAEPVTRLTGLLRTAAQALGQGLVRRVREIEKEARNAQSALGVLRDLDGALNELKR